MRQTLASDGVASVKPAAAVAGFAPVIAAAAPAIPASAPRREMPLSSVIHAPIAFGARDRAIRATLARTEGAVRFRRDLIASGCRAGLGARCTLEDGGDTHATRRADRDQAAASVLGQELRQVGEHTCTGRREGMAE